MLEQFGATEGQARRAYLRFMRDGIGMEHKVKSICMSDPKIFFDTHRTWSRRRSEMIRNTEVKTTPTAVETILTMVKVSWMLTLDSSLLRLATVREARTLRVSGLNPWC